MFIVSLCIIILTFKGLTARHLYKLFGVKGLKWIMLLRYYQLLFSISGNHVCVAIINNYIPKSDVDYYTIPQGLETEPKLPPTLAAPLHKFIMQVSCNWNRTVEHQDMKIIWRNFVWYVPCSWCEVLYCSCLLSCTSADLLVPSVDTAV
jgi:hypothetical protein